MEYILALSSQGKIFLFSLGFGFILGFLYDIFRFFRVAFPAPKLIFALDFLYFIFCAFLTFFFLLVIDSGQLRLSSAAGEIIGFAVYFFTCGVVFRRVAAKVSKAVKTAVSIILKPFKYFYGKILILFKKTIYFFKKTLKKSIKKQNISCKTQ